MRAFSRLALTLMIVLVGTGLANTWFQVGSVPALVGTSYGWLLLAKVSVLLPVLLLARHNRRRLLSAIASSTLALVGCGGA